MTAATLTPSADERRAGLLTRALVAAFIGSYIVARTFARDESLSPALRLGVGLLPAVIGAGFCWRLVQIVRSLVDELERRIQLEAFAFAFPAGLLVSMALGIVDWSGVVHVDPWDYWFFHLPMYFLGLALARRRYR